MAAFHVAAGWNLPCEIHEIEPGIIFSLTNRNGSNTKAVDTYPVAPFNNLSHSRSAKIARSKPCAVPLQQPMNEIGNASQQNSLSVPNLSALNSDGLANESVADNGNNTQLASNCNAESRPNTLMLNNQALYVNPKQYYRILRRREIRTQLRNRLIRENKVQTLYNVNGRTIKFKSRHKHAKRRKRGPDGQFLSKKKKKKAPAKNTASNKQADDAQPQE